MTSDLHPEDNEIPAELEAAILEDFAIVEKERRRSTDISAGFYDKLAALNAGSIAVSVSFGLAVLNKQDLLRPFSRGLLALIFLLWLSLILSIGHNFLLVWAASLEAKYSGDQFVRNTLKRLFRHYAPSSVDVSTWKKVEERAHEQPMNQQAKTFSHKQRVESIAKASGIISVISFLIAYTLVLAGAWKIWR